MSNIESVPPLPMFPAEPSNIVIPQHDLGPPPPIFPTEPSGIVMRYYHSMPSLPTFPAEPYSSLRTIPHKIVSTIEVHNLLHKQGLFTLSIPDLKLYPGQLTYIGGESGSGKSTLMKILALEQTPTEGDVYIFTSRLRTLSSGSRNELLRRKIMYIPQKHYGLMDCSAQQNVQRPLQDYKGLNRSDAQRLAYTVLDTVGLPEECFKRKFKTLSGGQKARVAIAMAYAIGRPICLADEILADLDQKSRMHILRLFQELARNGFTVVIVAHQPDLQSYFHRVIEMKDGHIISDKRHTGITS